MRLLDLADNKLRVFLTGAGTDGSLRRLTILYPDDPYYRNRIMTALADILRPQADAYQLPAPQEAEG